MIINASNLTKLGQAVLSIVIRFGVIGAIAGLDYLAKVYTGWAVSPYLIPFIGLAISESDSWLVQWEKSNIPSA